MTADMLEHNRDLMSRLESAGAPVLRLRAEAPVERNAHTTRDFLRGLA